MLDGHRRSKPILFRMPTDRVEGFLTDVVLDLARVLARGLLVYADMYKK